MPKAQHTEKCLPMRYGTVGHSPRLSNAASKGSARKLLACHANFADCRFRAAVRIGDDTIPLSIAALGDTLDFRRTRRASATSSFSGAADCARAHAGMKTIPYRMLLREVAFRDKNAFLPCILASSVYAAAR